MNLPREQTPSALGRQAARGGLSVVIAQAVEALVRILGLVFLGWLVQPRAFGIVAAASVLIVGWASITSVGLPDLVRAYNRTDDDDQAALALAIGLGTLIVLAAAASSPAFLDVLRASHAQGVVLALSPLLLAQQVRLVFEARLDRGFRYTQTAWGRTGAAVVGVGLAAAAAIRGAEEWALAIQLLATEAAALVTVLMLSADSLIRPRMEKERVRSLLARGTHLWGNAVVVFAYTNADDAVVSRYLGSTSLGFYAFAFRLANLPVQVLSHALGRVLVPSFREFDRIGQPLDGGYVRIARLLAWAGAAAGALITVCGPGWLSVVYGDQWAPAHGALRWLGAYGAARVIGGLTGAVFLVRDQPQMIRRVAQWQTVGMLGILLPLTLRFGIEGAAAAVVTPLVVAVFVAALLAGRLVGARPVAVLGAIGPAWLWVSGLSLLAWMSTAHLEGLGGATVRTGLVVLGSLLVGGWLLRGELPLLGALCRRERFEDTQ